MTERRSLTDFIHNAKTGHADEIGNLRDQLFAKTEECTNLVLKVTTGDRDSTLLLCNPHTYSTLTPRVSY